MAKTENTLTYLLTPISNFYWSRLEEAMNKINLHSGQVFVLLALYKEDGQSQIELSKNLNLAPPTINKMVKSLVKNDFISTGSDARDGRIVRIYLTKIGSERRELIEEKFNEVEKQILINFTETEKLILFQLFEKLKINLSTDEKVTNSN